MSPLLRALSRTVVALLMCSTDAPSYNPIALDAVALRIETLTTTNPQPKAMSLETGLASDGPCPNPSGELVSILASEILMAVGEVTSTAAIAY
jgi:hypothetical protein